MYKKDDYDYEQYDYEPPKDTKLIFSIFCIILWLMMMHQHQWQYTMFGYGRLSQFCSENTSQTKYGQTDLPNFNPTDA